VSKEPRVLWVGAEAPSRARCDALHEAGLAILHIESAPAPEQWVRSVEHAAVVVEPVGCADGRDAILLARVRGASAAPLVVVGRPESEALQSLYYDIGADDQLDAQAGAALLRSCLRALVARGATAMTSEPALVVRFGALCIDIAGRRAAWAGQPLQLTQAEHRLLYELARHSASPRPRAALVRSAPAHAKHPRTLDVAISRLRRALRAQTDGALRIAAVPGIGYRLIVDAAPARPAESGAVATKPETAFT